MMTAARNQFHNGWSRSGTILAMIDLLVSEGHDPESVLGKQAMQMAEASNAYRQVDLSFMWSLFQKMIDCTSKRDFGMRLGLEADLNLLGPWGLMFLNAATVGDALRDFARFGPLFQSQTHFGMERTTKGCVVEYSVYRRDTPGWEVDAESCW